MRQLQPVAQCVRCLEVDELDSLLFGMSAPRAWLMGSPHLEARVTQLARQDQEREAARDEVVEALTKANKHAKGQPHVIELFAAERPTKWTTAHRYLNDLLDQYEAL